MVQHVEFLGEKEKWKLWLKWTCAKVTHSTRSVRKQWLCVQLQRLLNVSGSSNHAWKCCSCCERHFASRDHQEAAAAAADYRFYDPSPLPLCPTPTTSHSLSYLAVWQILSPQSQATQHCVHLCLWSDGCWRSWMGIFLIAHLWGRRRWRGDWRCKTDNYKTRGAVVEELGDNGGRGDPGDHLLDYPTMCASFLAGKDGSSTSEEEEEEAGGRWCWGGSRPRLSIRLHDMRGC